MDEDVEKGETDEDDVEEEVEVIPDEEVETVENQPELEDVVVSELLTAELLLWKKIKSILSLN